MSGALPHLPLSRPGAGQRTGSRGMAAAAAGGPVMPESGAAPGAVRPPAPHRLSVVVPCYNEEAVLPLAHPRLLSMLDGLVDAQVTGELVYVDDGSRDGTLALLRGYAAADPRVRVLSLSRNFGHQIAVTAGLDHASGDAVAIIDADLQDPPELIPEMVARWRAGADVVYAERSERAGETRFKLASARLFYRLLNALSDVEIPRDTGDFRLIDRRVVTALAAMPERARFLRGMVSWVGFRQEPIRFQREARAAGTSKYPFWKMLRFALDGILAFSTKPLQLATWIGMAAAGLAVVGILYALALRLLTDVWVSGWTLLFIAVLFLGGVQLIVLGIIGQYLGRLYEQAKGRPLYLLAEAHGFGAATGAGSGAEPGP